MVTKLDLGRHIVLIGRDIALTTMALALKGAALPARNSIKLLATVTSAPK